MVKWPPKRLFKGDFLSAFPVLWWDLAEYIDQCWVIDTAWAMKAFHDAMLIQHYCNSVVQWPGTNLLNWAIASLANRWLTTTGTQEFSSKIPPPQMPCYHMFQRGGLCENFNEKKGASKRFCSKPGMAREKLTSVLANVDHPRASFIWGNKLASFEATLVSKLCHADPGLDNKV